MNALHTTSIRSLPLVSRGKVRDVYAIDQDRLLMITSDRISAFDVAVSYTHLTLPTTSRV